MSTLEQTLQAAGHPDPKVRQEAAMRLGTLADASVGAQLVDLLVNEPDFYVRETLTWVVVAQQEATTPHLVAALEGEDVSRVQVLHALSKIRDPQLVDRIVPLAYDQDPAVAAKAWWALGRTGVPGSAPALLAHLGATDEERRRGLTSALEQFGEPGVPLLVERLGADDPQVRRHALEVLARIGDPGARAAVPALLDVLRGSEHKDERVLAVEALGELQDPTVDAALEELRGGEDTWLATMADWLLSDREQRRAKAARRPQRRS